MKKFLAVLIVLFLILIAGFIYLLSQSTPDTVPEDDIVIELELPEPSR